jgi:hypothetical protein
VSARAPRRAPRLRSDERLAGQITRLGRFRRIDPSRGRPLPPLRSILAVAAWAALLLQSFRRARAGS